MPLSAAQIATVRSRISEETSGATLRDDTWLLVHLTYDRPGFTAYAPDTVFAGFSDHHELRGPRWRPLSNARGFADIGDRWIAAGPLTMSLLSRFLLLGNRPRGIIMHRDAVERWAPELATAHPVLNSVEGFVGPRSPGYASRAARRPSRGIRQQLRRSCHYCDSTHDLTLHHLIRREMGGATEPENLLCVCRSCHTRIHAGLIDDIDQVHRVILERVQRTVARVNADEGPRRTVLAPQGERQAPKRRR